MTTKQHHLHLPCHSVSKGSRSKMQMHVRARDLQQVGTPGTSMCTEGVCVWRGAGGIYMCTECVGVLGKARGTKLQHMQHTTAPASPACGRAVTLQQSWQGDIAEKKHSQVQQLLVLARRASLAAVFPRASRNTRPLLLPPA